MTRTVADVDSKKKVVYCVRSWRHGDCYVETFDEAIAHVSHDLDSARPGTITVKRLRVSRSFWEQLPEWCDHTPTDSPQSDPPAVPR